eukprot:scaffold731_cov261-Pinguiococcus_pyrenoidosus.AAC.1
MQLETALLAWNNENTTPRNLAYYALVESDAEFGARSEDSRTTASRHLHDALGMTTEGEAHGVVLIHAPTHDGREAWKEISMLPRLVQDRTVRVREKFLASLSFNGTVSDLPPFIRKIISEVAEEPSTFEEAMADERWVEAATKEYSQLLELGVIEEVPRERAMTVISSKWVWKVKLDSRQWHTLA